MEVTLAVKLVGVSRFSATPELVALPWQAQPFASTVLLTAGAMPVLSEVAFGTTDAPINSATSARKRRARILNLDLAREPTFITSYLLHLP